MTQHRFALTVLILMAFMVPSCEVSTVPKPVGYYRIDVPQHEYKNKSPDCPFSFEISEFSQVVMSENTDSLTKCWFSIVYPNYHAEIYITYKSIADNDLRQYIEESRSLAFEHQIKASRISMDAVRRDSARVFGLTYDLGGDVASPYQFYLTDSTRHFLRGSLYFNARPNPDSIAPVLDFIRTDLEHFIETLRWK